MLSGMQVEKPVHRLQLPLLPVGLPHIEGESPGWQVPLVSQQPPVVQAVQDDVVPPPVPDEPPPVATPPPAPLTQVPD